MSDCAAALGKHLNTISFIFRSDIFQEYYAQRRADHAERLDEAMRAKLSGVASKSLDVIMEKLEKQGDQIPMKFVTELATGALDRLGYAPASPGVNVNIDTSDRRVVNVAVSAEALTEARDALRAAEERRAIESRVVAQRVPLPGEDTAARQGAGSGPIIPDLELDAEDL